MEPPRCVVVSLTYETEYIYVQTNALPYATSMDIDEQEKNKTRKVQYPINNVMEFLQLA